MESFYSRGLMFVDCQNFAGSWGRNLLVTGLLLYNTGQFITLLNVCGDVPVNLWVGVTHEINKH